MKRAMNSDSSLNTASDCGTAFVIYIKSSDIMKKYSLVKKRLASKRKCPMLCVHPNFKVP